MLSGSISDGGVPLSGVEVAVTTGPDAGMTVTANPLFRLYGVAGETEIRASKPGYETVTRQFVVTPAVAEFLSAPSTYVTFFGSVVTTATGNGYSGSLDGNFEVLKLGSPWDDGDAYSRLAYCRSAGHQFTLTR